MKTCLGEIVVASEMCGLMRAGGNRSIVGDSNDLSNFSIVGTRGKAVVCACVSSK